MLACPYGLQSWSKLCEPRIYLAPTSCHDEAQPLWVLRAICLSMCLFEPGNENVQAAMSSSPLRSLAGHTLLLLLASAPLATQAYDPSQRSCVGDNVCLTSFHWCAADDGRDDGQTGCSFPDGAYPRTLADDQLNAALLTRGRDYIISWKEGDPTNENSVTITWNFGSGYSGDGANLTWGPKWETSESSLFLLAQMRLRWPGKAWGSASLYKNCVR